jgi:hypothetical protein
MKLFKRQHKSLDSDSEENSAKVISKEKMESSSEFITVFVGLAIISIGALNAYTAVPKEFAFGATVGGMFFALSDFTYLKGQYTEKDLLANSLLLFSGVMSFFLLPVVLIMFPEVFTALKSFGDFSTFFALGIVVCGLGFKSFESKAKYKQGIRKELEHLVELSKKGDLETEALSQQLTKILESQAKHKEVLNEMSLLIEKLEREKQEGT